MIHQKHTNSTSTCAACELKLKDAHPSLAEWFRENVKHLHPDCHVSWSFRGEKDQNEAHAEGKSQLAWPMSAHNKSDDQGNPCAMALDLFQLASNGMSCWSWKYFKTIAAETKQTHPNIEWGGNWKTIADSDHFELKP